MSTRLRIFGSFILVAAIGIATGVMGIISFSKIVDMNAEVEEHSELFDNTATVLSKHFEWRHAITQSAMTGGEFKGSLDPETCALGSWLNSEDINKVTDPQVLSLLDTVKPPHTQIHNAAKNVVDLINDDDLKGAQKYLTDELLPLTQTVIDTLGEMNERAKTMYSESADALEKEAKFYSKLMVIMVIIVVVVSVVMALFVTSWISGKIYWFEDILDSIPLPVSVTDNKRNWSFINKPVEGMLNVNRKDVIGKPCSNWGAGICNTANCGINCLERGQLQTTFEQMGMDFKVDVAYLTDAKNRKIGHIEIVQDITAMVKSQKADAELVKNIAEVSSSFIDASRQIADGAHSLASGSTQQAATLQQLSASVSDITDKTRENAERTSNASSLASKIMNNAEKGTKQMEQMIDAVNEINQANQSISRVIKAIDDIAFQTNILALNAAVEAARAGAAGKGFAVVAEEVRNLAGKSAESAKDTSELIANSIEKAQLGTQIAGETAASLNEIVSGIGESNRIIADIARSSEEQNEAINQINLGITGTTQVVQQNSATAEQSAAASEEMSGQANVLDNMVKEFQKTRQQNK